MSSWFGIDPKLWRSAKRFRVSTAAMGLWSMAGSWSREEKTAGFVPRGALRAIAPDLSDELALALADELVGARVDGIHEHGFWIPMANGWQFNDWDDYQHQTESEAEKAERISALRREAGLRGAQARWQNGVPVDGKNDGNLASAIGGTRARSGSSSETGREELSDPEDSGSNLIGQDPDARGDGKNEHAIAPASPFRTAQEREAFGYWADIVWRKLHPKGEPRASRLRITPFRARLREGATPEQFRIACLHVAESRFHFGENDTGRTHIEPKTLFGSAEKLETWLAKKKPATKPAPGATPAERAQAERDADLLDEIRRGLWGEKAKARALDTERPIDPRLFRQAIHERKVTRVGSAQEPQSGPRASDVRALTGQIGRTMR